MQLINPIDQETLKHKFQNAAPFPHFCIDNFLDRDFANEIYDSFPSFQDAQIMGQEFSAVNEKNKVQITDATNTISIRGKLPGM